jgi:hypothetical protein
MTNITKIKLNGNNVMLVGDVGKVDVTVEAVVAKTMPKIRRPMIPAAAAMT